MVSSLVPVLVAALCAGAVLLGYALSEARTRRRFAALEASLRGYAASHDLALVPFAELSGVPSDVGPPLVRGEVQGVSIELTVHSSTRPLTSVEASLPGVSSEFTMVIRRRRRALLHSLGGLVEAPTGNKAFDAAFTLLSNQPDLARSLVDRRLAHVVLGFPRKGAELFARENRLHLAWRGMETEGSVLDAAIEVVFTACRRRA
jgi:hypothetical protein